MWRTFSRVALVIAAAFAAASLVATALAGRLVATGTRTEGTATATELRTDELRGGEGRTGSKTIFVQYEAIEVRYQDAAGVSHDVRGEAGVRAFRKGDVVPVLFPPLDPGQGTVLVGLAPWQSAIGLAVGAALSGIVGLGLRTLSQRPRFR
jgi:hypothetical protein